MLRTSPPAGEGPRGRLIGPAGHTLVFCALSLLLISPSAILLAQAPPLAGGCAAGALDPAHDQPGVVCEDFDTDRNGSGAMEWSRVPRGAHPCDPLGHLLDLGDDLIGTSLDGGATPLGIEGTICSTDSQFTGALATCHVNDGENDWHLHSMTDGCGPGYDSRPEFDTKCALEPHAHSGTRSLHLGRHLETTYRLGEERDTYRFRQTSAFVLDPVVLGPSPTLEFWHMIEVMDDRFLTSLPDGTTNAGGQVQISVRDPNLGVFEPWRPLTAPVNGYNSVDQETSTLCEFDPGDDSAPPGDETLCGGRPQWSDIGDINGTDVSCTTDTNGDDPDNLDCGSTTHRLADPNCTWVADPGCGSQLENGDDGAGVWARSTVDLSPWAGREARIRWVFQGGGGWAFGESRSYIEPEVGIYIEAEEYDDGWYIDDIKLTGVVEPSTLCEDADQDGYSCSGDVSCACSLQADCGCFDAATYPGAPEICDGVDNDCDLALPPEEVDGDGDGVAPCQGDCSDADGTSFATPPPASGMEAAPDPGGVLVAWDDMGVTAGTGTVYDVYTGLVSDLHGPQGYKSGDCAAEDLAAPAWLAAGDDPPAGDARYYFVRGQNGCPAGDGTWGNPTRDAEVPTGPQGCD